MAVKFKFAMIERTMGKRPWKELEGKKKSNAVVSSGV